jgi:hypothetical protein
MGSLHPILFFVFVYVVALLCSVFICSSLFYSCNASSTKTITEKNRSHQKSESAATGIAFHK